MATKKIVKKVPRQPRSNYEPVSVEDAIEANEDLEGRILRVEEFCRGLAEHLRRHGIHVEALEE